MYIPPLSQCPQLQLSGKGSLKKPRNNRPHQARRRSRVEASPPPATSSTLPRQSGDSYSDGRSPASSHSTSPFQPSTQSPGWQSPVQDIPSTQTPSINPFLHSPPQNSQPSFPEPLSASALAKLCYEHPPRYSRTPSPTQFENPDPGARRKENESNEDCRRRLDSIFEHLDRRIKSIEDERQLLRTGKKRGSTSYLKSKAKSLDYLHPYYSKRIESLVPLSHYIDEKLTDEQLADGRL